LKTLENVIYVKKFKTWNVKFVQEHRIFTSKLEFISDLTSDYKYQESKFLNNNVSINKKSINPESFIIYNFKSFYNWYSFSFEFKLIIFILLNFNIIFL